MGAAAPPRPTPPRSACVAPAGTTPARAVRRLAVHAETLRAPHRDRCAPPQFARYRHLVRKGHGLTAATPSRTDCGGAALATTATRRTTQADPAAGRPPATAHDG